MSDKLYRIDLTGSFDMGANESWEELLQEAVDEEMLVPVEPDRRLQDIADAWGLVLDSERRLLLADWPMLVPLILLLDALVMGDDDE